MSNTSNALDNNLLETSKFDSESYIRYDYSEFDNLEQIGEGCSAIVYRAGRRNSLYAIKFHNYDKDFVKEVCYFKRLINKKLNPIFNTFMYTYALNCTYAHNYAVENTLLNT